MYCRIGKPFLCLSCFFLLQVIFGTSSKEQLSKSNISEQAISPSLKLEKSLEKSKNKDSEPELSKKFANFIKEKSEIGTYHVKVKVGNKIIPMDVFPTVFPPQSNYSASSKSIFETFKRLDKMEIADIGTGSGIESIIAIMTGANHVDAGDINPHAVDCAKHNIKMNGLQNRIKVFKSDLFQNFPPKKYDLIIANLPIVNFDTDDNYINNALYDKDFKIHKRFFANAKNFLTAKGVILIPHSNHQSAETINPDHDFQVMEKMINEYGYEITEKVERKELGLKWINYTIKLKNI